MANMEGFDAETVPEREFKLIPNGKYNAVISSSSEEKTAGSGGTYFSFKLLIIDGEHKGRVLFDNVNMGYISHEKTEDEVKEIIAMARATMASICKAVGKPRPKDTRELHNIPLVIEIGNRMRKDTKEPANNIKKYLPASGATAVATAPAQQSQRPTGQPAWKK